MVLFAQSNISWQIFNIRRETIIIVAFQPPLKTCTIIVVIRGEIDENVLEKSKLFTNRNFPISGYFSTVLHARIFNLARNA